MPHKWLFTISVRLQISRSKTDCATLRLKKCGLCSLGTQLQRRCHNPSLTRLFVTHSCGVLRICSLCSSGWQSSNGRQHARLRIPELALELLVNWMVCSGMEAPVVIPSDKPSKHPRFCDAYTIRVGAQDPIVYALPWSWKQAVNNVPFFPWSRISHQAGASTLVGHIAGHANRLQEQQGVHASERLAYKRRCFPHLSCHHE